MIFKSFLKLIWGSGIAIISFSCVEEKNSRVADPLYFNLIGFVDSLVLMMDSANYSLQKELTVAGISETKSYPDVDWKKELEPFKDCDINSPVLRETYKIKARKATDGIEVIYTPKIVENSKIELLSIFYDPDKRVKRITGKIASTNILYSSERHLNLTLTQVGNKTVVRDFSIKNKEGLIFNKPSLNKVKATVISSF